jgi:hypothetical protein
MMGHSSLTITLDRYGHLMPGSEDEAAELLDAYLDRRTRPLGWLRSVRRSCFPQVVTGASAAWGARHPSLARVRRDALQIGACAGCANRGAA